MGLLCGGVSVRMSSFSTPAAVEDSWPEYDGSWGGGGGAEPHTCQMICHYRGVSSQLSPSNHPSYPSSHPPPLLAAPNSAPALQKHLLHSLASSGFTHSAATPSAPPFLHSTPRENVPLPETVSTLCGCACPTFVYLQNVSVYLRAELYVSMPKANRRSRI